MRYYVIALVSPTNSTDMPKKYWWGPFTEEEAKKAHEKRLGIYDIVAVVREI